MVGDSDASPRSDPLSDFVRAVGVEISLEDATVLADRTEGWAAGVQLAALSMRYEANPAAFIRAFAGTDRNVADFLVGEILQRQPAAAHRRILSNCNLKRPSDSLEGQPSNCSTPGRGVSITSTLRAGQ